MHKEASHLGWLETYILVPSYLSLIGSRGMKSIKLLWL